MSCLTQQQIEDIAEGNLPPNQEEEAQKHMMEDPDHCYACYNKVQRAKRTFEQKEVTETLPMLNMKPKRRFLGIFPITMFLMIILISACGGGSTTRPVEQPIKITDLPADYSPLYLNIGNKPLINTNKYSVGIQCNVPVPAPGEVIPAEKPHPGFGDSCPDVILWKVRN